MVPHPPLGSGYHSCMINRAHWLQGIALASCFTVASSGDPCSERFGTDALRNTEIGQIEGWPLAPETRYRVASTRIIRQPIFNTEDALRRTGRCSVSQTAGM